MEKIVKQFDIQSEVKAIRPLKIGHINDSFVVESKKEGDPSYFLQKINHHIFKNVEGLQSNIQKVTDHLRKKKKEKGEANIERRVLQLIPTKTGELFYKDENGDYWRVYVNIENTNSYDVINSEFAYKAGEAFGDFQCMLSDIDTTQLIETIPNFHNMEFRLEEFRDAVKRNAAGRLAETQWMVDEIEKRAEEMCKPERLFREGKLVKRINHCDTKVNNVLFDEDGSVLCVVDLDTVMPGYVLSDFGDFMRTGANTGAEDDKDLSKIGINMQIFEAYAKGYAEKAKQFLLPVEIDHLAFGAKLLTYMQTVRFFTDYLNGDTYYKIQFPEHNMQRTLAQLQLLKNMEANYEEMCKIVKSVL